MAAAEEGKFNGVTVVARNAPREQVAPGAVDGLDIELAPVGSGFG
jgi:hypothetical protein